MRKRFARPDEGNMHKVAWGSQASNNSVGRLV